jgi:cobalt-zinc-cadmium resistance protein CzcA
MLNRIVDLSLRYKLLVLLAFVLMAFFGVRAFLNVPVDAFPDVTPNQVNVYTESPGLAAEDVEQLLTTPIETAMAGLPGVEQIRSVSLFGLSYVGVYFKDDVDIYFARRLVGEKLQEAKERLPAGYGEPSLGPNSSGLGQVFWYTVESADEKLSAMDLRTLHDWTVRLMLRTAPGVDDVTTWGGQEKQYQVQINPEKLIKYGLSFKAVMEALAANNRQVGGQYINLGQEQYLVRGLGLVANTTDIGNVVIAEREGVPIHVREVAEVKEGPALRFGAVTRDGKEVALGIALARINENPKSVVDAVKQKLDLAAPGTTSWRQHQAGLRPYRAGRQGARDRRKRPRGRIDPGGDRALPVPRGNSLGSGRDRHFAAGDAVRLSDDAIFWAVGQSHVSGRSGDRHRHDGGRCRGHGGERLPLALA